MFLNYIPAPITDDGEDKFDRWMEMNACGVSLACGNVN